MSLLEGTRQIGDLLFGQATDQKIAVSGTGP